MNSGLQHTIYHYEVQPPGAVWEKIEEELDDSCLSSAFPQKLKEAAIVPPEHAWATIIDALENNTGKDNLAAKLQAAEALPPAGVWQKIETALDTGDAAVQPFKKIRPLLRYAAAAAIAGLLLWGGYSLLTDKPEKATAAVQNPATDQQEKGATPPAPTTLPAEDIARTGADAAVEEARNDAALEASKKTYAKLDAATIQKKIRNVSSFDFGATAEDDTAPGKTTVINNNINHRYIVLMTPEGNIIRMSKKLKDLVCCISGEEVDAACLDQMKRWREKIMSSSAVHAPGNFADILDLVTSLQDNGQ
ncbi:MAG TPA: hypothetical protein VFV31_05905 [Chitinophagaceae bacterium]|nr:hypothetical protein [Chitinophagaceae bacterium]